jgi:hypothetical protein
MPITALQPGRAKGRITETLPSETDVDAGALFNPQFLPPRQWINPIRGLTPARAVQLIEAGQFGYKADLMWTYAATERKEPVLRALKDRRLSAIKKLQWTIRVKDSYRERHETDPFVQDTVEEQKQILEDVYESVDNLTDALRWMALATFRGFSHLEKHVDEDGMMFHLEPVPQWYWAFSYPIRDWLFNPQAMQTNSGARIEPDAFVIRECEDPLDEIALIIFLRKNLSKKDWDMFVETFGVPSIFAVCADANMRSGDASTVVGTMEKIIANGRGVLPPGWSITSTASAIGAATHPFQPHLDYQNMELVLAGTGGKLTMLSDPTGIGQGASGQHAEVFADIAEGEGEEICQCFRRQIDRLELKRRGHDKAMVEFALEMKDAADKEKAANILGAVAAAGFRVSDDQASEMLEMEVTSAFGQQGGMEQDMFGGEPGAEEPGAGEMDLAEQGGEGSGDEGGEGEVVVGGDEGLAEGAANKASDYDAPSSQPPAAPQYKAAMLHKGGPQKSAELLMRIHRPYAEVSGERSVANPDPRPYITTYPTAKENEDYLESMRTAIRLYQRKFAKGVSSDLKGVRKKIRRILSLDNDDKLVDGLRELEKELPSELTKMLKNSAAAKAMESALTESIERGAKPKRP